MSLRLFGREISARALALAVGGATALACGLTTAAAVGAARLSPEDAARIARLTRGGYDGEAFTHLTAGMDPAMMAVAARTEGEFLRADLPAAEAPTLEAEPAVLRLQDLTPEQAIAWNAANPVHSGPNPSARPFKLRAHGVLEEARAVDCLAAAVYYEAAWEPLEGQRAVAQVVLNRVRHPAFPKSVCGVVFQGSQRKTGCQFSFTCDGSMNRPPQPAAWARAREVAVAALNGHVMKKVGNATHYHAEYVAPYWSPGLLKVGGVGSHVFYRWTGGAGLPGAFGDRYEGRETHGLQIAALDRLAAPPKIEMAETAPKLAEILPVEPPKAPPAATEPEAPAPVLTVAEAAVDAEALVKADDLDWRGRPKQSGPPRIAMPNNRF
ncbi:MAG: cell wall hydrolase [Phenylobacterium sp.]|uniref:cell wall hydrolase n=1 Tax=Phenylobacterium sp. TaxID=1871053 RepID=UPI00391BB88A